MYRRTINQTPPCENERRPAVVVGPLPRLGGLNVFHTERSCATTGTRHARYAPPRPTVVAVRTGEGACDGHVRDGERNRVRSGKTPSRRRSGLVAGAESRLWNRDGDRHVTCGRTEERPGLRSRGSFLRLPPHVIIAIRRRSSLRDATIAFWRKMCRSVVARTRTTTVERYVDVDEDPSVRGRTSSEGV